MDKMLPIIYIFTAGKENCLNAKSIKASLKVLGQYRLAKV